MEPTALDTGGPSRAGDELRRVALAELRKRAQESNTARAYRADFASWCAWCDAHDAPQGLADGPPPLPADFLRWAMDLAGVQGTAAPVKLSTLRRRVTGAARTIQRHGHPDPRQAAGWAEAWEGIARTYHTDAPQLAEPQPQPAIPPAHLRRMVAALPLDDPGPEAGTAARADHLVALRDRAYLILSYLCALRRSEAAGLPLGGLHLDPEGSAVVGTVYRRKTGKATRHYLGALPGDALDPVGALDAWHQARGDAPGPLFLRVGRDARIMPGALSAVALVDVVKRAAKRAGLTRYGYTPHSFRAGNVTEARRRGVDVSTVQRVTGHASPSMVERYDQATGASFDASSLLGGPG